MTVYWMADLAIPPGLPYLQYTCEGDATPPPPDPVGNLTLHSYCTNESMISLDFSWEPPIQVNGVLGKYEVCIGPNVLEEEEGSPFANQRFFCSNNSVMVSVECMSDVMCVNQSDSVYFVYYKTTVTSATWNSYFIPSSELYFQVSFTVIIQSKTAIAIQCTNQDT